MVVVLSQASASMGCIYLEGVKTLEAFCGSKARRIENARPLAPPMADRAACRASGWGGWESRWHSS